MSDQHNAGTVSALINQLQSSDRSKRSSTEQLDAIFTLGELGDHALPAVPALEPLLDHDLPTCWCASDALFRITGDDSSVIMIGNRLLADPDELVRVVGVEHLMQLGTSVAQRLNTVAVEDSSDLVRNKAAAALSEISIRTRVQFDEPPIP